MIVDDLKTLLPAVYTRDYLICEINELNVETLVDSCF